MPREDIIGGLKVALSKGHTLQSAMQSFYNAGYTKEDIYDAARQLQKQIKEGKDSTTNVLITNTTPTSSSPIQSTTTQSNVKPLPVQKVSGYTSSQPKKNIGRIITITLLAITLLALIGGLVAVFIYKDKIVAFFGMILGLML